MTNAQYKIFKAVCRYHTLQKILDATKVGDYMDLQDAAGVGMLDFSDNRMDEKTTVTLTNAAAEAYEGRMRDVRDKTFTRCIAIYGAVTATVAIILEVVLHFS